MALSLLYGPREDEIVECYHQLNGHEFEQTLGDGEGQGSLACCHPWGRKESDTTERLNNNKEELAEKALSLVCVHTQERPYEGPGRKRPSASWEESPHQKLNQSKL